MLYIIYIDTLHRSLVVQCAIAFIYKNILNIRAFYLDIRQRIIYFDIIYLDIRHGNALKK